jgi:hypothetical protein
VRREGREKEWVDWDADGEEERVRIVQREKETGISCSSSSSWFSCLLSVLSMLLLLGGGTTVMILPKLVLVLRVFQACWTWSWRQVQTSGLWCWRSGIRYCHAAEGLKASTRIVVMAGRSVGRMSRKWVLRLVLGLESGCWFVMGGSDRDAIGQMRVTRGRRKEVSILFLLEREDCLMVDFV